MALDDILQPEMIPVTDCIRLRKYDGNYNLFLPGYQDPVVYQNSEGIFDQSQIPDLDYVQRMCNYLARVGELYYIEVAENSEFHPIGDVTIKPNNPPVAIWNEHYRGRSIGLAVMNVVIERLRLLGYDKITGSSVYIWNIPSQKLHEKLGFVRISEDSKEYIYELQL